MIAIPRGRDHPGAAMVGDGAPRVLGGRLLRGSNVHHRRTVFALSLDPGVLAEASLADAGSDFLARFVERFAGLPCPKPAACLPPASRAALASAPGATLVDALLEAVLAVERFAADVMGRPDAPRFARVVPAEGAVDLVWEARAAWISRAAVHVALAGLMELLPPRLGGGSAPEGDFDRALAKLRRRARRRQWAPAAATIVRAASERGLPYELLAGSYVRLGEGVSQQVVHAFAARLEGADRLLERLLPGGSLDGVPVVLIAGDRGTRLVARALDRLLRGSREGVGLAIRDRTTIQGRAVDPTASGRRQGVAVLLGDPRVETAVGAISTRTIVTQGLGVERVEVAVFGDPASGRDRSTYAAAVPVVLAACTGLVVIHADNPFANVVAEAAASPERVVLVGPRRPDGLSRAHAAKGGLLVVPAAGPRRPVLAEIRRGREVVRSIPIAWRRAKAAGTAGPLELRRALLAAAAALALGEEATQDPAAAWNEERLRSWRHHVHEVEVR